MDEIMVVPEGFHHSIARRIVKTTLSNVVGVELEWALVDAALETAGIWTIRKYVRRQLVKIEAYVGGIPIYETCKGKELM